MAIETELEQLVVRLIGDGSSFQKMMKEAVSETKKSTEEVKKLGEKVEGFSKGIESFAKGAESALATLAAGLGFWETFHAFSEQADAEARLTAAMQANGRAVGDMLADYKNFATELQKITVVGDEVTLSMLQQVESFGVSGEAAKRAVRNAIALAAANGGAAESFIRMTTQLELGNTMMLSRYIPALRGISDDTERAAKAQDILNKMFPVAEAHAQTASGQLKVLHNAWGDFLEIIGEFIAKAVAPVTAFLKEVAELFQSLPKEIQAVIASVLIITTALASLSAIVGALTLLYESLIVKGFLSSVAAVKSVIAVIRGLTLTMPLLIPILFAGITTYIALRSALGSATKAYEEYDAAVAKSRELSSYVPNRIAKGTASIISSLPSGGAPEQREARKNAIQEQLEAANREIRGYQDAVRASEREVEELNTRWNRFTGNKILKEAQEELKTHQAELAAARDRVTQLQGEYNKIKDPNADPELKKSLDELITKYKEQRETIGMTAEEAELYKLKLKGLNDETLRIANQELGLLKIAQAQQKDKEETNKIVDALAEEYRTLTMTERELLQYNLAKNHANEVTKQNTLGIFDQIQRTKELNKLMEEGKALTEQLRTPVEKYSDTMTHLDELLDAGAISWETYYRALDDARMQFEATEKQAEKTKDEVTKLDAVLAGSAEAQARVAEFAARNASPVPKVANAAPLNDGRDATYIGKVLMQIEENTGVTAKKDPITLQPGELAK